MELRVYTKYTGVGRMTEPKKFDVWDHFTEHESWVCNICDEEIECSENKLIEHLENKHGMKFNQDD